MSLTHSHIACAEKGCAAVITVHPAEETRLRETHETFYCPAGHRNYFPGKTDEEKLIDSLQAKVRRIEGNLCAERVKIGNLVEHAKACPLGCGWHSRRFIRDRSTWGVATFIERVKRDVAAHLVEAHGATYPDVIEDDELVKLAAEAGL